MRELVEKVRRWGIDRNIVFTGKDGQDKSEMIKAQARKTLEEVAELLDAYAKQDIDKINDAIGDILVTLIVGASSDDDIFEALKEWIEEQSVNLSKHGTDELSTFSTVYSALMWYGFDAWLDSCASDKTYINAILELDKILQIINFEFGMRTSLKDCLELAYNEIKNRTGKVVNGQFIKD